MFAVLTSMAAKRVPPPATRPSRCRRPFDPHRAGRRSGSTATRPAPSTAGYRESMCHSWVIRSLQNDWTRPRPRWISIFTFGSGTVNSTEVGTAADRWRTSTVTVTANVPAAFAAQKNASPQPPDWRRTSPVRSIGRDELVLGWDELVLGRDGAVTPAPPCESQPARPTANRTDANRQTRNRVTKLRRHHPCCSSRPAAHSPGPRVD
jgi:hypothetical protein